MNWTILLTICCMCALSLGTVQVNVCHPDTLEPYRGTAIMTGSSLSVVVSNDNSNLWSGGLFIEGDERSYGTLLGRVKDPNSRDWTKSHLPAAGAGAQVFEWRDSIRWGFDLYTDDLARQSGKWFVLDYQALEPGPCTVLFYDYGKSWTVADPNLSIVFCNTPTRDFVADGIVNYADFSVFSSHWLKYTGTNDPNLINQADLDMDGSVDFVDVCLFADFWMYGVPGWQPKDSILSPQDQPEPKITYSIVDADWLSEISLEVGQSITLYISQATENEKVHMIDLEAQISDPNLGWIDNTPIDPNNPPGPGTARLLFEPRDYFFDYWGPGATQAEGIEFMGINIFSPIANGAVASFIYTAAAPGTVELNLADYISFSKQEKLVIHQTANTETMSVSSPETISLMNLSTENTSLSETSSSSEPTVGATSNEPVDTEELATFLEDIYDDDQVLQNTISKTSWDEFIDSVRTSEQ